MNNIIATVALLALGALTGAALTHLATAATHRHARHQHNRREAASAEAPGQPKRSEGRQLFTVSPTTYNWLEELLAEDSANDEATPGTLEHGGLTYPVPPPTTGATTPIENQAGP